ncbi:hypothetical protein CYMTET_45168 [Cymbomonas tetramitiformis]|uniref:Uncharacterized protein n=1 Tax=Cymbomonas tetramitiformis TaxID=36881 RepID=A0AAE0BYR0_9CHLO|nr:hypothetical protein CYMTET_45168 [Cymbomonas tetramitiformis]
MARSMVNHGHIPASFRRVDSVAPPPPAAPVAVRGREEDNRDPPTAATAMVLMKTSDWVEEDHDAHPQSLSAAMSTTTANHQQVFPAELQRLTSKAFEEMSPDMTDWFRRTAVCYTLCEDPKKSILVMSQRTGQYLTLSVMIVDTGSMLFVMNKVHQETLGLKVHSSTATVDTTAAPTPQDAQTPSPHSYYATGNPPHITTPTAPSTAPTSPTRVYVDDTFPSQDNPLTTHQLPDHIPRILHTSRAHTRHNGRENIQPNPATHHPHPVNRPQLPPTPPQSRHQNGTARNTNCPFCGITINRPYHRFLPDRCAVSGSRKEFVLRGYVPCRILEGDTQPDKLALVRDATQLMYINTVKVANGFRPLTLRRFRANGSRWAATTHTHNSSPPSPPRAPLITITHAVCTPTSAAAPPQAHKAHAPLTTATRSQSLRPQVHRHITAPPHRQYEHTLAGVRPPPCRITSG